MTFNLTKNWYNSQLTFQNLKLGQTNYVYKHDEEFMWKPNVEFLTVADNMKCLKTDREALFVVYPNKNFDYVVNSAEEKDLVYLFEGGKNLLHYDIEVTCEFICVFNFKWYPFDEQTCNLKLSVPENEININAEIIKYSGSTDMIQYYFKEVFGFVCPIS